jgi:hypothetical protein
VAASLHFFFNDWSKPMKFLSFSRSPMHRVLGLVAVTAASLLAAPAYAEAGSRICGVMLTNGAGGSNLRAVGFFQKINKGDRTQCTTAINYANNSFHDVGGTNDKGGNRIWRRVRGGSDGPFKPNTFKTYVTTFNQETCEDFSWYAAQSRNDFCVGLSRNKTYVFASSYGDFRRK